ncbi:MAG TPA: HEAT repeat domain-containing protein [Bacteroidales bacterium]|nr:hypothetical protein [Bacteroidales bacterium]HNR41137.1 HEAT repeat domain-containing protein [Bacteroidales bacterium]HQH24720.1 HEAT repeat domain-containing protein [Bacteroidales bacterium]
MRRAAILIVFFLSFAGMRAGSPSTVLSPDSGFNAVFVPDGLALFTIKRDEARINDLRILTKDKYPVQIGAFRNKLYAEIMYSKIYPVLGDDVILMEEDGFYKIRVMRIRQEPRLSYAAVSEISPSNANDIAGSSIPVVEENNFAENNKPASSVSDSVPVKVSLVSLRGDTLPALAETKEAVRKFFLLDSTDPWLRKVNYFGKSFAFINALIITIFLSILSMIILLVVILLNRSKLEKEEKLRQYLAGTYQSMIVDYLFSSINTDSFFEIASNKFRRQILIDQMIDVSVNLKGDTENKLQNLYLSLGLDEDSIRRAHDFRWHKKIKGFRELAFMNIKDANDEIRRALNSRNEILRMEAQIALVRLTDHDHFNFLSSLRKPFSLWEQITLHDLIIQHDLPVPSFKKWLDVENPTVVMFALRMIREFRQKDAEDEVRGLLEHTSPEVRRLAVQVAGDMDMRSTLDIMKRMYKTQDYNTCLEIIKSMGKMPDPSYISFLELVLDKEDDVQLQIEATKAIENNGEEGVKILVKLMKSEYKNYNIIVRHVLDRRIY